MISASQGMNGILLKNTGATARVDAFAAALPEAKFVYIARDGRAVAASLARVGFFPKLPLWWAEGKTPTDLASTFGSVALVAAEHWARQCRVATVIVKEADR